MSIGEIFVGRERIAFKVTRDNCFYRESNRRMEYLKVVNDGLWNVCR